MRHSVSPTGLKFLVEKREKATERWREEKKERERMSEGWVSAKAVHTEQTKAFV